MDNNKNSGNGFNGKWIWIGVIILIILMGIANSSSSKSSSSSSYQYGTRESYDAKYGQGAYDADKQLLDSMRDEWNRQTGK